MRIPSPLLFGALFTLFGCGPAERGAAAGGAASANSGAADSGGRLASDVATVTTEFRPGADMSDAATAVLDRYLSLSLGGPDSPDAMPAALDSVIGCDLGGDPYQPVELLASYEISGRSTRADTAVIRARVVTVAEVVASPDDVGELTGTQRVRRAEWEWDVVLLDGRWAVCSGPLYVFPLDDTGIVWRTPGASTTSARLLADSIRRQPGR